MWRTLMFICLIGHTGAGCYNPEHNIVKKETMLKARLVLDDSNEDAVDLCASRLVSNGFSVTSKSLRGINFSGPVDLFEKVFHAKVELAEEPRFSTEPELPAEICTMARAVYFPTQPIFFKENSKEN